MPYKIRNMIILGSITILIFLFGGYLTLWSYPKKIDSMKREIILLHNQAKQYEGLEEQYFQLEELIKSKKLKLSGLDKNFTTEVTFAQTYDYLNGILNYIGYLEFNMNLVKKVDMGKFGYNIYSIRGEGSFSRIFQFIWFIEKGPQMFKIKRLGLHSMETTDPQTKRIRLVVPFEMEVWSYYANLDSLPKVTRSLKNVPARMVSNPFQPSILRSLPSNVDNLIEVNKAQLKAVMADRILIEYGGKDQVMRQGDRVYLGRLEKINLSKNEAVFVLNKGGIFERYTLQMDFTNTN